MQNNITTKPLNQNKMKQTAVEWFYDQLEFDDSLSMDNIEELFKQAKAMEKEQIGYSEIDLEVAFFEGSIHNLTFNQWLEQFKNQKNNL